MDGNWRVGEKIMPERLKIEGQRFGRLVVIERIGNNKHRKSVFLCQCDCGNKIECVGSSLMSGLTTSCGCLQKEKARQSGLNSKKYNRYDLSGDYGVGYASNTNSEFYFDLEDYDKIKDYCWYESHSGYIESREKTEDGYKCIRMNRIVMDNPENKVVDHIKHNKLDNRKSYLRAIDECKNAINKSPYKNNTSGHVGIGFDTKSCKWRSSIRFKNKTIYLGLYDNIEDAIKARKEAEEKYFGEYSYDNSMNYQPNSK